MPLVSGFSSTGAVRGLAALAILFAACFATVLLLGPNRASSNADWEVLAASGDASWRETAGEGAWLGLQTNGRLPDGAEIRTGSSGTVVVARGLDRIEMRPGTALVLAARHSPVGALEIEQTSGSATYTVEKRPAGSFSVHTPYVVAVVKGTKFDVDISREETSVSVREGRVGVSDSRSGDSVDVTAGQRARSSRGTSGIGVETAAHTGGTPGAAAPSAAAKAADPGATHNASPKASSRGKSADAPGRSGKGGAGGNSGGSESGNAGGGAGGKGGGNGNGDAGGNGGGKGNDNAGGKGKGNGGGKGKDRDRDR